MAKQVKTNATSFALHYVVTNAEVYNKARKGERRTVKFKEGELLRCTEMRETGYTGPDGKPEVKAICLDKSGDVHWVNPKWLTISKPLSDKDRAEIVAANAEREAKRADGKSVYGFTAEAAVESGKVLAVIVKGKTMRFPLSRCTVAKTGNAFLVTTEKWLLETRVKDFAAIGAKPVKAK